MVPPLSDILSRTASPEALNWLADETSALRGDFQQHRFYFAFSGVSRRFDKQGGIDFSAEEDRETLAVLCPGFTVEGWDQFRLARVILLTVLAEQSPETYRATLQAVLGSADVREQVAIFSAFPLLPEPEFLVELARDGSRTNIIDVFDAIALDNPFPAAAFPEEGWNQLVLKSLFIDRPLYRMFGLDDRANATLSEALSNLAHERWAAGRYVSPELWRSCLRFVDDTIAADIEKVAGSDDPAQREAAALVVFGAEGEGRLDGVAGALSEEIERVRSGALTWETLGRQLQAANP